MIVVIEKWVFKIALFLLVVRLLIAGFEFVVGGL